MQHGYTRTVRILHNSALFFITLTYINVFTHIFENICIKMCSFATEQPSQGPQHVSLLRNK